MTAMGFIWFLGLFAACLAIIVEDEVRKARATRLRRRTGVGSVITYRGGRPHHSADRTLPR